MKYYYCDVYFVIRGYILIILLLDSISFANLKNKLYGVTFKEIVPVLYHNQTTVDILLYLFYHTFIHVMSMLLLWSINIRKT